MLQDAAQFIEQDRDKIEDHNIFIPNEVVAEVVYVLEKVYKVERVHIFDSCEIKIDFDKKLNQLLDELRNA